MTFIEQIAPLAIKHGRKNNISVALILAQACLESSYGTSELAVNANNLFGIKKGSGWNGPVYEKKTAEQKEDGTVYYIVAEFRSYDSYEECVMDLCHKYTHGTGWEKFSRYEKVIGETDYKKATKVLVDSFYASDIHYDKKLNGVIEKYKLYEFDKEEDKMVKIFIDPGHGGTDPGAVGNGLQEKNLTLAISKKIRDILNDYENVEVELSRDKDETLSLNARTNAANSWGADYVVSVHINAFDGIANGYEDFIYTSTGAKTIANQNIMHQEITKLVDLYNCGKKRKNLHMVRESKASAILTENGFIDNPSDAKKLKSDSYLDKIALGHANGIVKIFGLKKKPVAVASKPNNDGTLYTVQVGAFGNKDNADRLAKELNSKGYATYVTKI